MLTKHRSRDLQSGSHGRNVTILVSHNRKKSYDHVGSNYTVYKYYIDQIYNSNKQGTIMAQYTGEHPPGADSCIYLLKHIPRRAWSPSP